MDGVSLTCDIGDFHVKRTAENAVTMPTTKSNKTYFTVVFGCVVNGQKLPPMVIIKRKVLPNEKFSIGVVDNEVMSGYLREV